MSFVNLSPALLDNGMKKRATKNVFVTSMGDRRKLKVCKHAPHSALAPLFVTVAATSCLVWLEQLPAHPSSPVTFPAPLLAPECSCICRTQMSDEEALRCAMGLGSSGLAFAQAGVSLLTASKPRALHKREESFSCPSGCFERALEFSRIHSLRGSFSHKVEDNQRSSWAWPCQPGDCRHEDRAGRAPLSSRWPSGAFSTKVSQMSVLDRTTPQAGNFR